MVILEVDIKKVYFDDEEMFVFKNWMSTSQWKLPDLSVEPLQLELEDRIKKLKQI